MESEAGMRGGELEELLDFARNAVEETRSIALRYFRSGVSIELKTDRTPVTAADKEIELAFRKRVEKVFPAHGVAGEEFHETNTDSDYLWAIDPIDGTQNFANGIPTFGTIIGQFSRGP